MKTIFVELLIDCSAAIREGSSTCGTTETPLPADLSAAEREVAALLPKRELEDRIVLLPYEPTAGAAREPFLAAMPVLWDVSPESVRAALAAWPQARARAEQAAEAARQEQREREHQTLLDRWRRPEFWVEDDYTAHGTGVFRVLKRRPNPIGASEELLRDPEVVAAQAEADRKAAESIANAERALREREEAEAREKKEAASRAEALSRWVATLGTPNQKARMERGLLPEREALALLREHVFAPLSEFPRFERLQAADLANEVCEDDVEYQAWTLRELSPRQWDMVSAIEQAASGIPGVTCTPRGHMVSATSLSLTLSRASLLVAATVDGISLSREYALPSSAEDEFTE